jgi:phosphoadenosine phosphosulfate reductase
MILKYNIKELNQKFQGATAKDILNFILNEYGSETVFSSSLGAEDQIVTDLIWNLDRNAEIITLDTGRLPEETYRTIEATEKKYSNKIRIFFPEASQVEKMVKEKGINLFYESIENRKECCRIRKLEPLSRALMGKSAWVTGLRREQSVTRQDVEIFEWDDKYSLLKVNPIVYWTEKDVWDYIRNNDIPYNELHDKNYPSIGCAPCTRAIEPGEDVRAGRWWWESADTKECGLHWKDGKLVRTKDL